MAALASDVTLQERLLGLSLERTVTDLPRPPRCPSRAGICCRCCGRHSRLAMLPLIGSPSSWVTLTVASLAMGMMIFIMASGLRWCSA